MLPLLKPEKLDELLKKLVITWRTYQKVNRSFQVQNICQNKSATLKNGLLRSSFEYSNPWVLFVSWALDTTRKPLMISRVIYKRKPDPHLPARSCPRGRAGRAPAAYTSSRRLRLYRLVNPCSRQVILEALKQRDTLSVLAQKYKLQPQQITTRNQIFSVTSGLSRLKLRVACGIFCGYPALENPLRSGAMRGNLRLD